MKTTPVFSQRPSQAFTLIELLVVIGIIGILAALLLPALFRVQTQAKVRTAQAEMSHLASAISSYNTAYGHFPVSSDVMKVAQTAGPGNTPDDFTFGGTLLANALGNGPWTTNNSEVIAILLDQTNYPASGLPTVNAGHVKNPKQIRFLQEVNMSLDIKGAGIGTDLVYRDPWGNPYVISIDLNLDEKCEDAYYRKDAVSQNTGQTGYNGLFNQNGSANHFARSGAVMVWSAGPDKTAAPSAALVNAMTPLNKDNVVSWK